MSAGGRVSAAFTRHAKVLGEAGYDRVKKNDGSDVQYLAKLTSAIALTADKGMLSRREFRLFYTWARWNEATRGAGIDSAQIYKNSFNNVLSGATFGVQAETWWG